MNKPSMTHIRAVQRIACTMLAALLLVTGLPLFGLGKASADSTKQFSSRSIQMSDSAPSGNALIPTGVGSGTNATYQVTFTGTHQAGSMVIDFCLEDPIIGDACSRPVGMVTLTSGANPITLTPVSGTVGAAGDGWTVTSTTNGQLELKDDGVSAHDIQAGATEVFDLNHISNPSQVGTPTSTTVGTFYGRMYDWPGNSYGAQGGFNTPYQGPTAPNPPNLNSDSLHNLYSDYGGIALSTAAVISITARVQEQLTFCIAGIAPSSWTPNFDCSSSVVTANPPNLTLGSFSGPTRVLSPQVVDNNATSGTNTPIFSQLSTNATHGAVIDMRDSNLNETPACGGLSADGTTCGIPAINGGSGAGASAMANGQTGGAAFGLFVSTSSNSLGGGVGTLTPASAYYNATHAAADPNNPLGADTWYGMDTQTSGNNTTSLFGSTLATTAGPVYKVDTNYVFAATAGLTTPAGIYTANLVMMATGTF
jgi:hypothetical protein